MESHIEGRRNVSPSARRVLGLDSTPNAGATGGSIADFSRPRTAHPSPLRPPRERGERIEEAARKYAKKAESSTDKKGPLQKYDDIVKKRESHEQRRRERKDEEKKRLIEKALKRKSEDDDNSNPKRSNFQAPTNQPVSEVDVAATVADVADPEADVADPEAEVVPATKRSREGDRK